MVFSFSSYPMRPSAQLLIPFPLLCVVSQTAAGAMLLMDLDSRQILQQDGNQIVITESTSRQLNERLNSNVVKPGETDIVTLAKKLAKTTKNTRDRDTLNTADGLPLPLSTDCNGSTCDGIFLSFNPLSNGKVHRLLTAVFGATNEAELTESAANFLRNGHLRYKTATVIPKGETVGEAPVFKGATSRIALVPHEDVVITISKTQPLNKESEAFTIHLSRQQPILAPLNEQTSLGTLSVWLNGHCLQTVPVYPKTNVPEGTFWQKSKDTIFLITHDITEAEKSK